jgi:cysteine synthase A
METCVRDMTELIGNTPIIRLSRLSHGAEVLAKLEFFNPGGSIKDRVAWKMIQVAEEEGRLQPGGTIIEPTSGNTGVGLAMVAASRGYKCILVMPETMSIERRQLLAAFGAQLILTPGSEGMSGAIRECQGLLASHPDYFMPQQFENKANPQAHRETTAQEILRQIPGEIDAFVSTVGTGGTLTGIGEVLKETYPNIRVVAVEPASSPVLSGGKAGSHGIQGIGAGFVPQVLNTQIIDEVITVADGDAFATARKLAAKEGLLVGISSGAACWASLHLAERLGPGKRVLTIFPDTGERYLSLLNE